MSNKAKIKLPNGEMIERKINVEPMSNFQMLWINYKGSKYLVGEGDEYLRGFPEYFTLGKKIRRD